MPKPPEGEADLRQLAGRFELAESQIRELITEAALGGHRRALLTEALRLLIVLRGPVATPAATRLQTLWICSASA